MSGCQTTDPDAVFRLENGNNVDITNTLADNMLQVGHRTS